jgi:hypothetical protein
VRPADVQVTRSGRRFDAQASFVSHASRALAWETLIDYEQLPRFMPGIRACTVVARRRVAGGAEELQVEQRGEFRFLLFAQTLTVHLDVRHEPQSRAHARATRFDLGLLKGRALETFEGTYELAPVRGGVEVRYRAVIVSRLPPPPGIGSAAVRLNLAQQLNAVAAEIERRRLEAT